MEHRGTLLRSGKVARSRVDRGPGPLNDPAVGDVYHKVTRYNLRRAFVVREWIVRMRDDDARFVGNTRGDVVAQALAHLDQVDA